MADKKENMDKEMNPEMSEKPSKNHGMPWMGGIVLILIGVIFLIREVSGFELNNWWALFILIPATGAFASAWRAYQNAGNKFTSTVQSSLIGGLAMALVASIFLFNLNWTLFFPAILILSGISILASSLFRS